MSYQGLLTQTLTYWSPSSQDGFGGISYSTPVTIKGRYQEENDTYNDFEGEEFISNAVVYTNQELGHNGWIYNGTSVATNPQTEQDAYRIRRLFKTQTPNASIIVYKYILG